MSRPSVPSNPFAYVKVSVEVAGKVIRVEPVVDSQHLSYLKTAFAGDDSKTVAGLVQRSGLLQLALPDQLSDRLIDEDITAFEMEALLRLIRLVNQI